jgi:hypothetical protein
MLQTAGAAVIRVWVFVFRAQEPVESIQAIGPEALVKAQPLMGAGKRSGLKTAMMGAPAHLAADHAGALQNLDMLRRRRQRNRKWGRQFTHRPFPPRQITQHLAAGGVSQGMKDGIHLQCLLFNHVVEYKRLALNSQPYG